MTTTTKVVGLDPSLQSFGFAVVSWVHGSTTPAVDTYTVKPRTSGFARLDHLIQHADDVCRDADLVVLEGPAYGSARLGGTGHHERGGLWWGVGMKLWEAFVQVAIVPPNVRAKYATGRGNASKDDVLLAVARRYTTVPVRGNDEADSLCLAAMGARAIAWPLEESLPAAHLEAMTAVTWPSTHDRFPLPAKKKPATTTTTKE